MISGNQEELIEQANKAFLVNDKDKGLTILKSIFKNDFTNEPAWKLLYKVTGGGMPFDSFQREVTRRYFPDKAYLLVEKELDNLLSGISMGNPPIPPPLPQAKTTEPPALIPVKTEASIPQFCINCGSKVYSQGSFCPACGNPIQTIAEYRVASENIQSSRVGQYSTPPGSYPAGSKGFINNNSQPIQSSQDTSREKLHWDNKFILPIIILAVILILLFLLPMINLLLFIVGTLLLIIFVLQKLGAIEGRNIFVFLWKKYYLLFEQAKTNVNLPNAQMNRSTTILTETPQNISRWQITTTFFLAELGLILLIFSYSLPWFSYNQTTFLIINNDQTFSAKRLMSAHGTSNFDITVLFFYILTCFSYILSRSRAIFLALLSSLGAIGFQIYNLSELQSMSNISASSYAFLIPESFNTGIGPGPYLAMGAVLFMITGILISILKKKVQTKGY